MQSFCVLPADRFGLLPRGADGSYMGAGSLFSSTVGPAPRGNPCVLRKKILNCCFS
jgi:hypothetical protein